VCSPLRDDDRRPSFSIFANGQRFKDHATGETGDSFDFYQRITKMDAKTAWRRFKALAGNP
jgi:DNA primase